jgi:hypothetical protein
MRRDGAATARLDVKSISLLGMLVPLANYRGCATAGVHILGKYGIPNVRILHTIDIALLGMYSPQSDTHVDKSKINLR